MLPIIIYAAACIGALVFELAFKLASSRFGRPHSKSQWALFFWTSAFVLCALTLMRPFDGSVPESFCPMVIVAAYHIQMAQQHDILAHLTKPPSPPTP